MRYFYSDSSHRTTGPLEASSLYQACRLGAISPRTMVTTEGVVDWKPLEAVLPYDCRHGDAALGPLTLRQIDAIAATSRRPVLIAEPGSADWFPLSTFQGTKAPVPPVAVAVPVAAAAGSTPASLPAALPAHRAMSAPLSEPPEGVLAAGKIWMLLGAWLMLRAVSYAITTVGLRATPVPGMGEAEASALHLLKLTWFTIQLLIGTILFRIGREAVRGTIAHPLRKGLAFIFVALFWGLRDYWLYSTGDTEYVSMSPLDYLVRYGVLFLLLLSGIMAATGSDRFLAWQAEQQEDDSPRPPGHQ